MRHFIAYHSVRRMGVSYGEGFGFFSTKPGLERSVGHRAWVIEGDDSRGGTLYSLRAVFVVDAVQPHEDGSEIIGTRGVQFGSEPMVFLNDRSWFPRLRSGQGNFGFGFNPTTDDLVIDGLLLEEERWLSERPEDVRGVTSIEQLDDEEDRRRRVLATIVARQGQPEFRRRLMAAYDGRCSISGWDVPDSLEAAHIMRYLGPQSNDLSNGLLLRADLHMLFDLGLITIDAESYEIIVDPSLRGTQAQQLHGSRLRLPGDKDAQPSREALRLHAQRAAIHRRTKDM
jgi:hypothetical protein